MAVIAALGEDRMCSCQQPCRHSGLARRAGGPEPPRLPCAVLHVHDVHPAIDAQIVGASNEVICGITAVPLLLLCIVPDNAGLAPGWLALLQLPRSFIARRRGWMPRSR